jgi:dienelactone hydrolase
MGAAYVSTAPTAPAVGSESAIRLEGGLHPTERIDLTFVDRNRTTPAHGGVPEQPERTLDVTLWFPRDAAGDHPLVVYSHGFMSFRREGGYLAENLASHGMVVVAADYPVTHFWAPGGPDVVDTANQPGDVSFLIDSLLALEGDAKPFAGRLDPERIGVVGLSLGGLTTTLVTFHPDLRDPRVRAAVSIAGPALMFSETFFTTTDAPFLMIAGTEDAMVDFATNAPVILERARNGALLAIEGASHAGFSAMANLFSRFIDHPDRLGCFALMRNLALEGEELPFPSLGGESAGILVDVQMPRPCTGELADETVHPGRQQMITKLAVTAFFEAAFADDPAARDAAARYLRAGLAGDFAEVTFTASR